MKNKLVVYLLGMLLSAGILFAVLLKADFSNIESIVGCVSLLSTTLFSSLLVSHMKEDFLKTIEPCLGDWVCKCKHINHKTILNCINCGAPFTDFKG